MNDNVLHVRIFLNIQTVPMEMHMAGRQNPNVKCNIGHLNLRFYLTFGF